MTEFQEIIDQKFGKSNLAPEQYSALGLAYIGDAVYDLVIRTLILRYGNYNVKTFHRMTSSIVKAEAQAQLARAITPDLTQKETEIFHHGRNAKSATSAKNASIVDYRIATGLESLMGYLYLKGEVSRMMELIAMGLERTGQYSGISESGMTNKSWCNTSRMSEKSAAEMGENNEE